MRLSIHFKRRVCNEKLREGLPLKEYAVYKGDKLLAIGTAEKCTVGFLLDEGDENY